MGQVDVRKGLDLNRNTWNHKTKLFVLRQVTLGYNFFKQIEQIKPYFPFVGLILIGYSILVAMSDKSYNKENYSGRFDYHWLTVTFGLAKISLR